ncbi:MAG TPA: hypothetical protein VNJ08_10335 [Bacteriovoracaceae bacterium]|nr:hypothetical protein [Bacteriovoracaceae bacterium]
MKNVFTLLFLITTALSLSISSYAKCVNKDPDVCKRKEPTILSSGGGVRKMMGMQGHISHEMQHGFIISDDESFFSHLVATGHHSHQLDLSGSLTIQDVAEKEFYLERKKLNTMDKKSYFLFQAQKLNLPFIYDGQSLVGHIVESPIGNYTPQNIIVRDAKVKVEKVHINVSNPFFTE